MAHLSSWDSDPAASGEGGIGGLRMRCRFKLASIVGPRTTSADGLEVASLEGTLVSPNCGIELQLATEEARPLLTPPRQATPEVSAATHGAQTTASAAGAPGQVFRKGVQLRAAGGGGDDGADLLCAGADGGGRQPGGAQQSVAAHGRPAGGPPAGVRARIPKQMRANVTLTGGRLCVAQAVLDSDLCLVHLTTGLVVEDLFAPIAGDSQIRNPFRVFSVPFLRLRLTDRVASAGAALLMFVLVSFFEMKLIVLIWKARPCLHSALARLLALRPLSS